MKHAFGRLAAVLLLVSSVLTFTAAPAAAYFEACDLVPGVHNHWAGENIVSSNPVRGVKATINPIGSTFRPCQISGGGQDASLAWVAIVPSSSNTYANDTNAIIQVGIVDCDETGFPNPYSAACEPGTIHFFYAAGGCGHQPVLLDLGATNDFQHTFEIRHGSTGGSYYDFYIDGSNQNVSVISTDNRLSCWINQGEQIGQYDGEIWDKADGLADSSNSMIFSGVRFTTTDGTPTTNPNWGSGNDCTDQGESTGFLYTKCDISNSVHDQFYIWTQNTP